MKRCVDVLICLILICFSGFRYQVGTDYIGYEETFYKIVARGRFYDLEWGFYFLVKFIHSIGGTPQLMFFFFSAVTMFFICKFINYFSEGVELSWIVFLCIGPYFLSTFNGVRQWLAVAIFAYSLRFVVQKKFLKYLLCCLVAGLFHYSAFIMIPIYFVLRIKKFTMTKTIISYLAFFLLTITGVISYVAEMLHADSYLEGSDMYDFDATYLLFLILSILCWLYLFLVKKDNRQSAVMINLNYLSMLTVFLVLTTSTMSNMIFIRFNTYFFIGYVILVPNLLKTFPRQLQPIAKAIVVVACFAYYFYLVGSAADLTPYLMNFHLFE